MKMDNWCNTCRACLSTSESFIYSLFENVSPEVYLFCTSVKVIEDALPKSLCNSCYGLLNKFSEFKKLCLQSENILHNTLTKCKSENKNSECTAQNLNTAHYEQVTGMKIKLDVQVKRQDLSDTENEGPESDKNAYEQENATPDSDNTSSCNFPDQDDPKPMPKKKRKSRKFEYACELCHKRFCFRERYEAHKLEHEGKTAPISCPKCNKTCNSWGYLKKHIDTAHEQLSPEQLTCPECLRVYKTRRTLELHLRSHDERRPLCDVCGKAFKSDITLKRHLETHIENRERRYPCQHCGKKYLTKKTRGEHVYNVHKNRQERRYICHYCDHACFTKRQLAVHLELHEGRKYKCDICSKTCTSKFSLNSHIRTHTGEKPFACSHCPSSFVTKARLGIHNRIHTGEKPYQCTGCEKSFRQRGTLTLHMKRRHKTIST